MRFHPHCLNHSSNCSGKNQVENSASCGALSFISHSPAGAERSSAIQLPVSHIKRRASPCASLRHPETMRMREAPWSAAAKLPPSHRGRNAVLSRAVAAPKPQGGVKSVKRRTLQGTLRPGDFRAVRDSPFFQSHVIPAKAGSHRPGPPLPRGRRGRDFDSHGGTEAHGCSE